MTLARRRSDESSGWCDVLESVFDVELVCVCTLATRQTVMCETL